VPRSCRTCQQPEAEAAVLAGEPFSVVAKRFGISKQALRNHMANHVGSGGTGAMAGMELDEWRRFCGEMYDALAPWPDARQAAADAIRRLVGDDR
jgi:hypothetical protein